ncbi:MAG: hypothetical protein L3J36_16895 [Rhodobacteraceae bacterium]|nr:hypothetical protein [Paracoccaceae bacterium]
MAMSVCILAAKVNQKSDCPDQKDHWHFLTPIIWHLMGGSSLSVGASLINQPDMTENLFAGFVCNISSLPISNALTRALSESGAAFLSGFAKTRMTVKNRTQCCCRVISANGAMPRWINRNLPMG